MGFDFERREKEMKRFAVVVFFCLVIAGINALGQKDDLWVLAVGIDSFSENQAFQDLSFCVSDAKEITGLFKAQEGKAFNKVNTLLIADTEAIKPVKADILSNMSFFRNAKPNDTVIFYFASHSMLDENGDLYLLASDSKTDANKKPVTDSMINFNDIAQSFNARGKKIIIFDTHFSETAIKAAAGKNIAVFGACKDDEQAREGISFGGGLFTSSIVNAFKEGSFKDGKITLQTLFPLVADRVKKMSNGQQNPVLYIPSGMGDPALGKQ